MPLESGNSNLRHKKTPTNLVGAILVRGFLKAHSITVNHVDQKVATIQKEFPSFFLLVAIRNALSVN